MRLKKDNSLNPGGLDPAAVKFVGGQNPDYRIFIVVFLLGDA